MTTEKFNLAAKPDTSRWLAAVLNSAYWTERSAKERDKIVSEASSIFKVSDFSRKSLKLIRAAEKVIGIEPQFTE